MEGYEFLVLGLNTYHSIFFDSFTGHIVLKGFFPFTVGRWMRDIYILCILLRKIRAQIRLLVDMCLQMKFQFIFEKVGLLAKRASKNGLYEGQREGEYTI